MFIPIAAEKIQKALELKKPTFVYKDLYAFLFTAKKTADLELVINGTKL